ncbi:co-chaperone GroES [Candidatus Gracilibacteria bacterium]|nr:co-chaperone GroES [Candidatus Gracilibacteria bacterium]
MNIQPLFDRVILKSISPDESSSSGIFVPESTNKERTFLYEVIAVGPGKTGSDMSVISVGDTVLAGQFSGDEVKVDDTEYKVVAIEYILGKINK